MSSNLAGDSSARPPRSSVLFVGILVLGVTPGRSVERCGHNIRVLDDGYALSDDDGEHVQLGRCAG